MPSCRTVSIGDVRSGADVYRSRTTHEATDRPNEDGRREKASHAYSGEEANEHVGGQSNREIRGAKRTAARMTTNEAAAAELAALVSAVEQCLARLTSLAEARRSGRRTDDNGDSLVTAIYEAERGLNAALRMLQRAQRTAR